MAADPLSALGAAGSSIAVAEAALKVCRQIYTFLGELHGAGEEIKRLRDMTSRSSDILAEVGKISQSQLTSIALLNQVAAAMGEQQSQKRFTPSASSTTDRIPDDLSLLSRIVRYETKHVLEPIAHRLEGKMDIIAETLAIGISKTVSGYENECRCHSSHLEEPKIAHQESALDSDSRRTVAVKQGPAEPPSRRTLSRDIKLFSTNHQQSSKFWRIYVRISKFRTRSVLGKPPESYFRIELDICLPPWLCSTGLSAVYSSGKNSFGCYDICPSIITFRIIQRCLPNTDQHFVWVTIQKDDKEQFQHMLASGEIGWRDQDEYGKNVFQVSPSFQSFPEDDWITALLPYVSVAKACGFGFTPLDFRYHGYYFPWVTVWTVELHLATGGDPNYIWDGNERGPLLLSEVLRAVRWHRPGLRSWLISDDECIQLLARVIKAGADVYALTVYGYEVERMGTLSDLADFLWVEGYWRAALEQCGYSAHEVREESTLRLVKAMRTRKGFPTSVDNSFFDIPDLRGLKQRGGPAGGVIELD
ncbi:hypothetical protein IL306_002042 [Fusarium sp. DS 682]|nr:hypothetical protein IL306_002042 [Fusarium sp. DS 682]